MGLIFFGGYDKKAKLVKRRTVLSYLQELGIDIHAECGGHGECKGCLVRIDEADSLNPLTDVEKEFITKQNYRLACQARILREEKDVFVEIPKRDYKILERGKSKKISLDPAIKVVSKKVYWKESREIDDYEGELYGVALDIGTTTLSMYLVDLETGDERFVFSKENPQIRYGNNVISRITYAREKSQRDLERTIREGINEMIRQVPIDPNHIYEMVVVGNSTVRDLFVGHSVRSLGEAPFKPLSEEAVNATAKDLEIEINPKANVYAFPLIGGFIGGDAVGVTLATGMYKSRAITMAIDIGTNTEIMIGNKERIIATSCASGPAFEGSGIRWGVGGVGGAISKVEIDDDLKVKYETIDGLEPIGICGSGLVDSLAQMLERGIIDWRGKFTEGRKEFIIVKRKNPITLDGEDVDKLKLAKSAISLGARVLMDKYGVGTKDLNKIYLAGAFANYINTKNAHKIGMLPEVPLKKIEKVGNAAVEGAREALLSMKKRKEAEELARKIEHVRLEEEKDFMDEFMKELSFKKYEPS